MLGHGSDADGVDDGPVHHVYIMCCSPAYGRYWPVQSAQCVAGPEGEQAASRAIAPVVCAWDAVLFCVCRSVCQSCLMQPVAQSAVEKVAWGELLWRIGKLV